MNSNIERLMKSFCEYQNMEKQIKQYMDDIKEDIIKELENMKVCEYIGTEHSCKYITVSSNRIDTKKVKSLHPEIVQECTTVSTSKRFTVK